MLFEQGEIMNTKQIKDVIVDIIKENDDYYKSVLIDGAWGCGKTTAVKEAINEIIKEDLIKKRKIVYQSLFGVKDVAELTACYSYVGRTIYRVTKSVASPFTKLIPIVGEQINEGINNTTSLFEPSPSQKKNITFIFDDLERADDSLSYVTLFGFFNQLIMGGCKIICLSSLNDLSKLERNNKKDLDAFLEKAFDRILYINEYPEEVIAKIFSDNEKTKNSVSQCMPMFNSNIRTAIKVHRLLKDIYSKSESMSLVLEKKMTGVQILKAAILSIKAIFSLREQEENKEKKETKSEYAFFEDFLYENQSGLLNETIKNNINKIMNIDSAYYLQEERNQIKHLAECLCHVEVHYDYSELAKEFAATNKKERDEKYEKSVFYLDDEGKKQYFMQFKKDILEKNISVDRQFVDTLVEIIKYTNFDISEDNLQQSVETQIVDNYLAGNKDAFNRLYDYKQFPLESGDSDLVKKMYDNIWSDICSREIENIKDEINNRLKENDYRYLADLISDVANFKKPRHIMENVYELLMSNDFYLPDISKNLTYDGWTYCHQVAKLASSKDELRDKFIETLKSVVSNHKNSASTVDRAKALIEYNFDANTKKLFDSYVDEIINK